MSDTYSTPERFSRTALIIGSGGTERLANARVIVFGVGGVGSFAAEALARGGVGEITLVDADTVSVTNINRQLIALTSTIGQYKAETMRGRILDINPDCRVTAINEFFSAENADRFRLGQYDYIVDAIDSVTSKLTLIRLADSLGVPIISSMGAGNKLDPTRFETADIYETSVCPLARVMRRELKKSGIKKLRVVYSKEEVISPLCMDECMEAEESPKRQVPGSISFVPSVVGLIIAGEVIRSVINTDFRQTSM